MDLALKNGHPVIGLNDSECTYSRRSFLFGGCEAFLEIVYHRGHSQISAIMGPVQVVLFILLHSPILFTWYTVVICLLQVPM